MEKSLLIFCSLFIVTVSCQPPDNGFEPTPSSRVSFSYVDEDGIDLLDPDTFNFFNIYYRQINDETGEFELNEARTPQYSFYRDINTGLFALGVFPNPEYIDGYSTTYIESARDDIDTLEVKARVVGQGIITEKVWYNGQQIWSDENPEDFYFTITKSGSF